MNEEKNEKLANAIDNLEQRTNVNVNQGNAPLNGNEKLSTSSIENNVNQSASTSNLGQPVDVDKSLSTNNNLQEQNKSPKEMTGKDNAIPVTNNETLQQASTTLNNNNAFSGVIDPSKITVGPEEIHPQIPVDNLQQQNPTVDNTMQNVEPKKNNTFSLILVFLLFVGVGAFIWFMPKIHQMLNDKKTAEQQPSTQPEKNNEEQPDHYDSMICSKIANTYTIYSQEDKIKKYSTSIEYTKEIETNYQACLTLQQSEVNGFVVGCDKATNSVIVVKTYDFSILPDTFTTDTLDFKKDDSVKDIKTKLEKQGYTCS